MYGVNNMKICKNQHICKFFKAEDYQTPHQKAVASLQPEQQDTSKVGDKYWCKKYNIVVPISKVQRIIKFLNTRYISECKTKFISQHTCMSGNEVRAILRQLIDDGYVTRHRIRGKQGRHYNYKTTARVSTL